MRNFILVLLMAVAFWVGQQIYFMPKFDDGEKVPEFEIELINGKTLTHKDLKGQYVLIDFWGSWCGPCRKESPELVKLFEEYIRGKDQPKLQIFSIGIETREHRWKKAIASDGLSWPWHYSSMRRFKDPLAKEFGVREIPTKYLVDPNGTIIAVNPTFAEIRGFVDQS